MSIRPPQSFDWTARNFSKLSMSGLKKWTCFFELQKFKNEDKDYAAKTVNFVKKKKSLFIYLLWRKGQQIYQSLAVKNAKGETVDNDDEVDIESFKDFCKPMKILTVDRVEFQRKEQSKNESFEDYLLNMK